MEAVSSLVEAAQQLPLPLLVAAATLLSLAGLLVLRVISNSFPGKAPPVDEGSIPFIGGLLKFSKVRCVLQKGGSAPGLVQLHQPPPLPPAAGEQKGTRVVGLPLGCGWSCSRLLVCFSSPGHCPLAAATAQGAQMAGALPLSPACLQAHCCPAAAALLAPFDAHYQCACHCLPACRARCR